MKKAFTLIELLAVIIILAVIALIATPVVLKVVDQAKASANLSSAKGVLDAGRLYFAESLLDKEKMGKVNSLFNIFDEVEMKGKPDNGQLYVNNKGLVALTIKIGNKCYIKEFNGELQVTDNEPCTMEVPTVDDTKPTVNIASLIEPNSSGWFKEDIYVKIEVKDYESGVSGYRRCINTTDCTPDNTLYTDENILLSNNGDNTICVIGKDNFGNESDKICKTYKIDKVIPTLTARVDMNEAIQGENVLSSSFFNEPIYGVSGGSLTCEPINTSNLPIGNHTVSCTAIGNSGNLFTANKSIKVNIGEFIKTYGGSDYDTSRSIIKTTDGDYILTGFTQSIDGDITTGNKGGTDILVMKLDNKGNKIWAKTYGGSKTDFAYRIIETTDGGYILTGVTQSTDGDIVSNKGTQDILIMKIDSSGNKIWVKTYGGTSTETIEGIAKTTDGGYVLTGYTQSTDGDITTGNKGSTDILVIKIDSNGNKAWVKTYGGSGTDYSFSLVSTNDGGFILNGRTNSNNGDITVNKGSYDILAMKIDSNGNKVWVKTYGGNSIDDTNSIILASDGGYVLIGYTQSTDGDIIMGNKGGTDILVMKIDNNGNKVWVKTYGGSGNDYSNGIVHISDNEYVLTGYSNSSDGDISNNKGGNDIIVIKINE